RARPTRTALLTFATLAPDRAAPDPGAPLVRIGVLDHGWHSGLVLPLPALRGAALRAEEAGTRARLTWLAARYPHAAWIEIGWGDAAFYRATPGIGDLDPWLTLRAALWPTAAAVQIVPGAGPLSEVFRGSARLEIALEQAAFDRLARALARELPGPQAAPLGPSLYGAGAFYPSPTRYHLLRTCNHWVSGLLRAAGLPSSPVPATLSAGLMAELRWRLDF
ncbi:MAG: DUF2459 domain-containing protein, partial [Pseudomonadota bacterium]